VGNLYSISTEKTLLLQPFIKTLSHYEKHKGAVFLVKVIKEIRIALESYLVGSALQKFQYIRLNYCGLPVILKSAIHNFKIGGPSFVSLVLSILTVGRSAKFEKSPNYSTISDESTGNGDIPKHIYKSFVKHLCSRNNVKKFSIPYFKNYHFSVKSSPLGDNSMISMLVELVSLPADLKSIIYKVGGRDLKFRMEFIISNYRAIASSIPGYTECVEKLITCFGKQLGFITPVDIYDIKDKFFTCFLSQYVRKMVSFAEYEGKTRIIGLCDYWSQVALEPLASVFFDILFNIPQDQTFDQAKGCKKLTFHPLVTYYSFDLTAFTDRFPMTVVSSLVKYMYSEEYSQNVTHVLCGVPF